MKNSIIVNILFALAIVVLYTLHFTGASKSKAFQPDRFKGLPNRFRLPM